MSKDVVDQAMIGKLATFVQSSADADIVDARTRGDTIKLRDLLNADAAGPVKAWFTPDLRVVDEASNWTSFDSLTPGKRESWRFFFNFPRDFSRNKVRSWITDVWGAAIAESDAEKILKAAVENASVAENVIGGTARATGTVSALDRDFVGEVTQEDCQKVLAA